MTIAPIDICFFVVVMIFGFAALIKGFVKELFSKVSFFGGLAAAIFLAPKLNYYVSQTVANSTLSMVISFLLIFVVVFLIICIIQHFVAKVFEGEIMRGLDKTLGFLLGFLEGLVVITFVIAIIKCQTFVNYGNIFEGSIFNKFLGGLITLPEQIVGVIS